MNKTRWIPCGSNIFFLTEDFESFDKDYMLKGFYYQDELMVGPYATLEGATKANLDVLQAV